MKKLIILLGIPFLLISCGSKGVSEQNDADSENVVQSVSQKEIEKKVKKFITD